MARKKSIPDLTGQTFGRLVAIGPNGRNKHGSVLWLCVCECWNVTNVVTSSLVRLTKSCGCIKPKKPPALTHGHSRVGKISPTYSSWRMMIQRCTNLNLHHYKYYGAKGVKVCERWLKFSSFLADMGPRPSDLRYTLSRKNDIGNYEPGNVNWEIQVCKFRPLKAAA